MTSTLAPAPARAPHAGAGPHRIGVLSVHTSPTDPPGTGDGGGLNVSVLETSRRLAALGVQVEVFTRRSSGPPGTLELADGLRLHRLDAGPPGPLAKEHVASQLCAVLMALERHPATADLDLLHAHYWLSGWVGRRLARRRGIPLVMTYHTVGAMKNAALAPGDVPEPPLRLIAEKRIAAAADRIAVLTCGEARVVHDTFGVSGARVDVVPPGVDLERFTPSPRAGDPRVAGDPLLLFVGRLQPLKGPDVAVRTLAALRATHPGARLVVIGGTSGTGVGRTGPDQLRSLAEELGVADVVELRDAVPQEELPGWYRAADVLLTPSRSETFGLVALEAQASGTPVVGADVAGLRATIGPGGALVAGHDPADHAAAVAEVLRRPARVQLARRFALGSSWDATVARLLETYQDVSRSRT